MRRLAFFMALVLPGCGRGGDADPVVTPTPVDAATTGTIRGRLLFEGTPPKNPRLPVGGSAECAALHSTAVEDEVYLVHQGRLQNGFVYVKQGLEKLVFDWPRTPVTIANEKCIYRPRVVGARVHQPIRFVNSDPTAHNIHGFSAQGGFNFTLQGQGTHGEIKLRKPEYFLTVKCDLHPWMIGYVGVAPHPFFQVTGPDGAFELKGVPPGEYVIEAWHERLPPQTRHVKLDPKGSAEIDFTFSAK